MRNQIDKEAVTKTQGADNDDLDQGGTAEIKVGNQILEIFFRLEQHLLTNFMWMLEKERVG